MKRKENIKEWLSHLMERHAVEFADDIDNAEGDVVLADEDALAELCRLVRPYPPLPGGSRVLRALVSWYVPRSVDDVDCFAKRYRVWKLLPAMVTEVLRKRKEQQ